MGLPVGLAGEHRSRRRDRVDERRSCRAGFGPAERDDLSAITKLSLRALTRRIAELDAELTDLDQRRRRITTALAPALVAAHGIGPDTATGLLLAAGENPDRLRSERSWSARLAANPIQASSGKVVRHRLNRGRDRQGNRLSGASSSSG